MNFWAILALTFAGVLILFTLILVWCSLVLAKRADKERARLLRRLQMDQPYRQNGKAISGGVRVVRREVNDA